MPSNPSVLIQRIACVSLDLEEDHAGLSGEMGYEGLPVLPEIVERLNKLGVPLTVFVSGNFLENKGKSLDSLRSLEFHSHGYRHPDLNEARQPAVRRQNMEKGLNTFEAFFKRTPVGYRAPYGILETSDLNYLHERGIRFDSSVFPCFHVSGMRPWLTSQPKYYPDIKMVEFPISSLFALRVPYSFSYMNLLGLTPYKLFSNLGGLPNPLILNFHLHDFMHTSSADRMSGFFKSVYGHKDFETSWKMFETWLRFLKDKGVAFQGMESVYRSYQSAWSIS